MSETKFERWLARMLPAASELKKLRKLNEERKSTLADCLVKDGDEIKPRQHWQDIKRQPALLNWESYVHWCGLMKKQPSYQEFFRFIKQQGESCQK